MQPHETLKGYIGQRMISRNLSDALSSRDYHSLSRELRRRAVVHNIMV